MPNEYSNIEQGLNQNRDTFEYILSKAWRGKTREKQRGHKLTSRRKTSNSRACEKAVSGVAELRSSQLCAHQPQSYQESFFFFWLHWVFLAVRRLSLVVAWATLRFGMRLLFLHNTGSRTHRLPLLLHTSSVAEFKGSRAQTQQLRHLGLVALWHMGSSQTRD